MGRRPGIPVRRFFLGVVSISSLYAQQPGASIFASNCAGCHGADGRGGEHAPNIATAPEVQHLSDSDLAGIIRNGISGAGMPAFSSLRLQQVTDLVAYLRVLQGRENAVKLPGDPRQGQALFFGKAHCSECHMVNGKGGFIGSDLSLYGADVTADKIRGIILYPDQNLPPEDKATTVVTISGQKVTGMLRVDNNFSVAIQTLDGAYHFFAKPALAQFDLGSRSLMPPASNLTSKEVDDLVSYLLRTGIENATRAPKSNDDDDN